MAHSNIYPTNCSLFNGIALLRLGADGETRIELDRLIDSNDGTTKLDEDLRSLRSLLRKAMPKPKLCIANRYVLKNSICEKRHRKITFVSRLFVQKSLNNAIQSAFLYNIDALHLIRPSELDFKTQRYMLNL